MARQVETLSRPAQAGPPSPARQLVVFCDGTNNTLTGRVRDTNVLRLYEHLSAQRRPGRLLTYDPGVGAPDAVPGIGLYERIRRKAERLGGLALGRGVFENVGQGYAFLVRHARPGDEIYLFGFSRGAFTARSLSGMIHLFGLLAPEHEGLIPTLLRVYFSARTATPGSQRRARGDVAAQVRDAFTSPHGRDAWVQFVGVWDTVASVGLWPFHLRISSRSTVRDKRFAHVRHALALDEHRAPFQPRLYSEDNFVLPGPDGALRSGRSLTQLWFRGSHCDVGGSYPFPEAGLSDDALAWIAQEAEACGLDGAAWPPPGARRRAHDVLHENALWALTGLTLRDPGVATGTQADDRQSVAPVAHPSVEAAPEPSSVWSGGGRTLWSALAALLGVVAAVLAGAPLVRPGGLLAAAPADWPGLAGPALGALGALARTQAAALWAPGALAAPDLAPEAVRALRAALLLDGLLIAAYAWLLARLVSSAFARWAGLRAVGTPRPLARLLGLSLPALVGADLLENLLSLGALGLRGGAAGPVLAMGAGLCSWLKLLALAGCLLLVGLGWLAGPRAPRVRRDGS